MQTQAIRQQITDAVNHEKSTGFLANTVRNFAQMQGRQIGDVEVKGVVDFIREYEQHVPALLEEGAKAAQNAGIDSQVMPILEAAEQYFFQVEDVIPDRLGLLGLMDDAYLAHCLLQAISDSYQGNTGKPLLATNMTRANQAIRMLIGEPPASILDGLILNILQGPTIQQALQQLINLGIQSPFHVPDPIYGNASIDDIVNARMGALGIV